MLQFIIGRARSGKSYEITRRIAKCIKDGANPVLLVPEQASFETEKLMLKALGDSDSKKVTVLSFSRLCDEVERLGGGGCAKALGESDKLILMSRAIKKATPFNDSRKQSHSTGYAKMLVDTIGEFKLNAVDYEDLKQVALSFENSILGQKIKNVAEIYFEYNSLLGTNFIDPSDRLTRLYNALETYRYFEGKTVFIDGFKGFTGQQFKILKRILSQCEDINITLTCSCETGENYSTFSNVLKTKRRIEALALDAAIEIADDFVAGESRFESEQLCNAEKLLSQSDFEASENSDDIVICKAQTVYDEAEFTARNIRRLVRLNKARYRDIVIIARNPQDYSLALKTACEKNSVNCYIDGSVPLSATPIGASVLAAAELLLGVTTERILRFFKSSLSLFTLQELSILENYVYLWGIDGKLWENEWDMNPDGFVMQEKDIDYKVLSQVNELRQRAITPILKLRSSNRNSAADMSRAIVEFLNDCSLRKSLVALCEHYDSQGKTALSSATRKAYDSLMSILNSMAVCFADTEINVKEYCDTLKSCILPETVATVPQTIDEATFGAADKIRPNNPKYVFIMGANQGVFPATAQNSGIFGNAERKQMIDAGLDIPDKTLDFSIDEDFLVYSSVCCASNGVYITYNTSGDAQESAFVTQLCEHLGCKKQVCPDSVNGDNLPETADTLFASLCSSLPFGEQDAATLISAAHKVDALQDKIEAAKNIFQKPRFSISPATAGKFFGKGVRMSPSRFEDFNRCAFMYFCKHTLKIRRLEPAEFSAMQRGTMAHYVLQSLVETYGKGLGDLDEREIGLAVERFAQMYLNSISGYKTVENERLKFIVSTVTRSLKEVARRLADEFAQSEFQPVKCELKIGMGGDMPEISVDVSPSGRIMLNGIVDRVDNFDGYVRVVDYKTGHRDFKLPDLLIGQNMQMLLYLYALCKDGRYGNKPAGVLYMPAFRQRGANASKVRMNGVISSDERIINAMEKDNAGKFIPKVPKTKAGDSFLSDDEFNKIFSFLDHKLKAAGQKLYEGYIAANPVDGLDSPACKYCDFASICRIENEKRECVAKMSRDEVMAEIERQVADSGN